MKHFRNLIMHNYLSPSRRKMCMLKNVDGGWKLLSVNSQTPANKQVPDCLSNSLSSCLSHTVMLQPAPLRGAGGHSRHWAEPCWRLTLLLLFLCPVSLPPSSSFKTLFSPNQLYSYITPNFLSYPSVSICPPAQAWQLKSLTSTRCIAVVFFPTGSWSTFSRSKLNAAALTKGVTMI